MKSELDEAMAEIDRKIARLGPTYLANRKRDVDELHQLIIVKDFKSISIVAHRIKGTAKTYGFDALSEIGAEMEAAAQKANAAQVEVLIAKTSEFVANAMQSE